MDVDTFIIPTRKNTMWKSVLANKLRRLIMKLSKRGKRVRAVLILIALFAIWQVSMNLWWTEDGYCWGTMVECMLDD